MIHQNKSVSRRQFVTGASAGTGLMLVGSALPFTNVYANSQNSLPINSSAKAQELRGTTFDLTIDYLPVNFTGKKTFATAVNGSVPAPTLRWREGDTVTIRVKNNLSVPSSIHWHGLILPSNMDGVPGLSFEGIEPGETFTYTFEVNQTGTYWYHSHSGFQEQTGVYGSIIIEPKDAKCLPKSHQHDREHVVVLSDWSDMRPENVYAKLKKMGHYFNTRERTVGDLFDELRSQGVKKTFNGRAMWNDMRMSDRDISDVTGMTYTFLMNGHTPENNWFGKVKAGERVRLRIINASAMTIFDVRIPNLTMTVVASDGQDIQPVSIDEFRIGVAETYDVIIEPKTDKAYCLFAQAIDRSGYTYGMLASKPTMTVQVPKMDEAPILTHADMGMAHGAHHGSHHSSHGENHGSSHSGHGSKDSHSQHMGHDMTHMNHDMGHGSMNHENMNHDAQSLGKAGMGSIAPITHVDTEKGAHIDMLADAPKSGLHDAGIGLRNHMQQHGRKVLTYADIKNLTPTKDKRQPTREIQLHLTGNMSRYMWSFNGQNFADAEPLLLEYGERVRIVLVNDTMMTHPIHLHGLWSELETGDPDYIPRKHTILVQPGSTISYLVTADAKGRWAYHCHLMYHMMGMMREVRVV